MKLKSVMGRSFAEKMFSIILPLVLVPIIILSIVEYVYTSSVMDESSYQYLASVAGVMMSRLQDSIDNLENVAFFVNGSDRIQDALLEEKLTDPTDRVAMYGIHDTIIRELTYMSLLQKEIRGIHIISGQGVRYSYWKNKNIYQKKEIDFDAIDDILWYCDEDCVLLLKKMYSFPEHQVLGMQVVDIDSKGWFDSMDELELGENGRMYLVDKDGRVVASEQTELIGKKLPDNLMRYLGEQESFQSTKDEDGVIHSVYTSKPLSNGWSVIMTIPMDTFRKNIARIRNLTIALTCVLALLAIFASKIVSRHSSFRILKLRDSMDAFAQGDFEVNCDIDTDDEIGDLAKSFNAMVSDINTLVNTVYEQKLLKQKAQMESLQLQINPHFLYNTLDTINWMSRMHGADDVGDMVVALGSMMRYSLSKNSFVPLREEVKNLQDYLHIQSYRYGDKMEASLEIDESLYDYFIPKLLIQPILENAIIHGLEDKLDDGHILVYAEKREEDIFITVEDDGVGMTEEAIVKVFSEDEKIRKKGHTSVGIVNVNKRIQMIYGSEYGLNIQSVLGAGTKMTLHIKALTKAPE